MSDKDLKSYIKSYYLDRKMTYTKLDKHDRAIGVLLEENKQLKGILQEIYERAINTNITSLDFRNYILEILGDEENE